MGEDKAVKRNYLLYLFKTYHGKQNLYHTMLVDFSDSLQDLSDSQLDQQIYHYEKIVKLNSGFKYPIYPDEMSIETILKNLQRIFHVN